MSNEPWYFRKELELHIPLNAFVSKIKYFNLLKDCGSMLFESYVQVIDNYDFLKELKEYAVLCPEELGMLLRCGMPKFSIVVDIPVNYYK